MGKFAKWVGYFFLFIIAASLLSQCGSSNTGNVSNSQAEQRVAPPDPPKVVDEATIASALKGLSRECDKMRDICWYKAASAAKFTNANTFHLYFGRTSSGAFTDLRLRVQYFADDWLFISNAWAKADDVRVQVPSGKWERDNNHDIWEWSDVAIDTPRSASAIKTIATAKSVVIRFEGRQYHNDRTLTATQLKALRDVITAYETVTGKSIE